MPAERSSPINPRGLLAAALAGVLVALAIFVVGLVARERDHAVLEQWAADNAGPHVSLVTPRSEQGAVALELPGRLRAFAHAPIHARLSGYLKAWYVDIGAQVTEGQLLGELETPDLDQQLLQAKADLALAEANAALSASTARRWEAMLKTQSVSQQTVDEKIGDLSSKRAMVEAARAALDRLVAMKQFARITAPFAGAVTARNAEIGALVNAGSGDGPPLFEISDTRRLRLYVHVPQVHVNSISVGSLADITVPDRPGRTYKASVESMSGAVEVASGSSLVQLLIDNANGELLPGGFASVSLHLPAAAQALSVPASALIFDQAGLRVATVNADNTVHLRTVVIARDLGRTVEIGSGLQPGDRVIENPPDGIIEGTLVTPALDGG